MRITDYPPVDLLTDNDVILIDGDNGTKKLLVGGDISKMTSSFNSSDNASETGIITSVGGETYISTLESKATFSRLFDKMSRTFLNTRKLINTVKRIWATVATSWASGETYAVGDVRLWTNGHTYICKLAHTSSSSITPANTTYWEDKTLGDMISSLNSKLTNKDFTHLGNASSAYPKVISDDYKEILVIACPNSDAITKTWVSVYIPLFPMGTVGHMSNDMIYRQVMSNSGWINIEVVKSNSQYTVSIGTSSTSEQPWCCIFGKK